MFSYKYIILYNNFNNNLIEKNKRIWSLVYFACKEKYQWNHRL